MCGKMFKGADSSFTLQKSLLLCTQVQSHRHRVSQKMSVHWWMDGMAFEPLIGRLQAFLVPVLAGGDISAYLLHVP